MRADLPPDRMLADPPPIPDLPGLTVSRLGHARVTLRCADQTTDAETVAAWKRAPHLVETWEQPWQTQRWRSHIEAQLAGTYSVPVIMLWEGARSVTWRSIAQPATRWDRATGRSPITWGSTSRWAALN